MPVEAANRRPADSGIAVFIDDNQPLLRTEKSIATLAGFEVREIGVGQNLDNEVATIFEYAKGRNVPSERIVFFIDNRMGEFAKFLNSSDDDKVVFFNRYRERMGQHGKHAGMAIAEWLVSAYAQSHNGFRLALLSGFSDEGITRRLMTLKQQYPAFLGFLTKIASDADKSISREERTRRFQEAVHSVVAPNLMAAPLLSGKAPANYPYGHVLLSIIQDLDFTPDEAVSFLRLSVSALPKLNLLYDDATLFELDTSDWQEKVFLVWELLLILEHDFEDFEKAKAWMAAPHALLNGAAPRGIIVSGLISEIDTLRAIVKY